MNSLLVGPQNLLELHNVVLLISIDQVGHGQHLPIILVGLGLLGIEGVHIALHQHVGQNQILEALDASHCASLIIVLECLQPTQTFLLLRFALCRAQAYTPSNSALQQGLLQPLRMQHISDPCSDCTTAGWIWQQRKFL